MIKHKEVYPISYGYTNLDNLTGGMYPGEMILLGARPGMGKTSLIFNVIAPMIKQGKSVMYLHADYSYGKTEWNLLRHIAMAGRTSEIRSGTWKGVGYACKLLGESDFYCRHLYQLGGLHSIDINPFKIKSSEIITEIRQSLQNESPKDILILDGVSLIGYPFDGKATPITYDDFFQKLKKLAVEFSVPVIVVTSWPRVCEKRYKKIGNARPLLKDLRVTAISESDFDTILFLYRDDYYNENTLNQNSKSIMEVMVAKAFLNSGQSCELYFDGQNGFITEF